MRKFAASWSLCFFALAGGLHAGQVNAATDIDWAIVIDSGRPPPPVLPYRPQIMLPQPVWVAESWYWNGGAYVLIPGHWVQTHSSYQGYAQPGWTGSRVLPRPNYGYGERRHDHERGHDHGRGHRRD